MATVLAGNSRPQHLRSQPLSRTPHVPPATTQPPPIPPTSQPSSSAPQPPNLYANAIPIPNEAANIYPDARGDIRQEHWVRFDAVKEFLHKGVERKKKRRNSVIFRNITNIGYELHMCGTSRTDAKASIVVFCPEPIVSKLKRLFKKSRFREQYCCEHACFNIHYWGEDIELLWGQSSRISLATDAGSDLDYKPSGLTMCGSVVTAGDRGERHSTVGLILRVQSDYYALTAAHPFHKPQVPQSRVEVDVDSGSESDTDYSSDSDDEELHSNVGLVDDLSDSTHRGYQAQTSLNSTPQRSIARSTRPTLDIPQTQKVVNGLTVRSPPTEDVAWNSAHPNCDWALVRLPERHQWRPNIYFSPDSCSPQLHPTFFNKFASQRPSAQRRVAVVSSRVIRQIGVLHPQPSYVGGLGSIPCEVWTVQLLDDSSLEKGDSGSVVVDLDTGEVYGHVVALNPLGHVYVVPFKETAAQIQEVFNTSDVCLPDNPELLVDLLFLYSSSAQHKELNNVIQASESLARATVASQRRLILERALHNWFRRNYNIGVVTKSENPRLPLEQGFVIPKTLLNLLKVVRWGNYSIPIWIPNYLHSPTLPRQISSTTDLNSIPFWHPGITLPNDGQMPTTWLPTGIWEGRNGIKCPMRGLGQREILDSNLPVAQGSFCLVYILLLCDIHYSRASVCNCEKPRQVVCKTPRTDNEQNRQHFDTEIKALTLLREFSHPNIINYLGSYQMEDKWGILLPMAEYDLDAYMSLSLIPGWAHFEWAIRQLSGIASALDHLHTGLQPIKDELGSSMSFNRHGDLKPSNILIFHNPPDNESELNYDRCGTWVLSDFGISRINQSDKVEIYSGAATPDTSVQGQSIAGDLGDRQYVAPETETHHCLSSASDIWSLGCVMLEVLVWLLYGNKGRQGFLLDLGSDKDRREPFWFVTDSEQIKLKPAIFTWMERLEGKTRKKKAFRPILELLQRGRVLDPDPKHRATAATVKNELQQLWQHASKDDEGCANEEDLFGTHFTKLSERAPPMGKELCNELTEGVDGKSAAPMYTDDLSQPRQSMTMMEDEKFSIKPLVRSSSDPENHAIKYPEIQQTSASTDNLTDVNSGGNTSTNLAADGTSDFQGHSQILEPDDASKLQLEVQGAEPPDQYNDQRLQAHPLEMTSRSQMSQAPPSASPSKLTRRAKDYTKQLTSELSRWSSSFCRTSTPNTQEGKSTPPRTVPLVRVTSDQVTGTSSTDLACRASRSHVRIPSIGTARKRSRSESRNRHSDSDPVVPSETSQLKAGIDAPIRMRSGGVSRDFSYFNQRFLDTK